MKHLYKLLQYPYIPNKIYSKIFKSEFNKKTRIIDGQDIRIWSDFSEKSIGNWIERWQAKPCQINNFMRNIILIFIENVITHF